MSYWLRLIYFFSYSKGMGDFTEQCKSEIITKLCCLLPTTISEEAIGIGIDAPQLCAHNTLSRAITLIDVSTICSKAHHWNVRPCWSENATKAAPQFVVCKHDAMQ